MNDVEKNICPFCGKNSCVRLTNGDETWVYYSEGTRSDGIALTYCKYCGSILTIYFGESSKNILLDENYLLWSIEYLKYSLVDEQQNKVESLKCVDKEMLRLKGYLISYYIRKGEILFEMNDYINAAENFELALKAIEMFNLKAGKSDIIIGVGEPYKGCIELLDIYQQLEKAYRKLDNAEKVSFCLDEIYKIKKYQGYYHVDPENERRKMEKARNYDVSPEELGLVWNDGKGEWVREDD
jgi:tetratricopeptide (TPR) repeat protein